MLLDTNFGYKAEVAYWKEEASCLEAKCDELKEELIEKQKYILELESMLDTQEKP